MIATFRVFLAIFLVSVCAAQAAGPAQTSGPAKDECALVGMKNCAPLAAFVASLQQAITRGDKSALAAMIEYPVEVNHGETARTISNKAAFLKHYDSIMTKSLCEAMLHLDLAQQVIINRRGVYLGQDNSELHLSLTNGKLFIVTIVN